jgi:hypothetical protein
MSVVEKASSAMNGHIHEHSRAAAFDGKQLLVKSCEDGVCKQEKLDTKEKIRRYILEKQPHSLTLMQRLKGLRGVKPKRSIQRTKKRSTTRTKKRSTTRTKKRSTKRNPKT